MKPGTRFPDPPPMPKRSADPINPYQSPRITDSELLIATLRTRIAVLEHDNLVLEAQLTDRIATLQKRKAAI